LESEEDHCKCTALVREILNGWDALEGVCQKFSGTTAIITRSTRPYIAQTMALERKVAGNNATPARFYRRWPRYGGIK
jgi:hypothetical protein